MIPRRISMGLILGLASASAFAGNYVASVSGSPGQTVTLNVTFAGDGATVDTEANFTFSNTNITITSPGVASNGALCLGTATSLRIVPASGGATPLSSTVTQQCAYQVAIAAGAPVALVPFTSGLVECFNAAAVNQACTVTAGAGVNVTGAPVGPTLSPPAGSTTIALAGGSIGQQVTTSIQFSAAGGTGGTTALNCTAVAPAVIVSGGTQTVATGSQPAAVVAGITLTAAAQSGTVTCNGTTFTLNAPIGAVVTGVVDNRLVVPANSTWSLLAMVAVLLGVGGLALSFRRNG